MFKCYASGIQSGQYKLFVIYCIISCTIFCFNFRDYRPQYEKLKKEKEEENKKQSEEQLSRLHKDMAEKGI